MEKFSFETILKSLECGREIEFSYNKKQYSITNSNGYWNFCCDTDNRLIEKICPFEDSSALISRISVYFIDSTPISAIFDEGKYDTSSIYIL